MSNPALKEGFGWTLPLIGGFSGCRKGFIPHLKVRVFAFSCINSGLIDGEYIPIERARDHVYDLWLEERVEGNLLLSAIYTLTVPGRELGFGMGKFFRGATTHDQWGIDRWPDGTLKR